MKNILHYLLLFYIAPVTGQSFTGIEWKVDHNYFTIGQDTFTVFKPGYALNTIDFSNFRINFHSNGTFTSSSMTGVSVNGGYNSNSSMIILNGIDTLNYIITPNGQMVWFDNFLSFDEQSGSYTIPAINTIEFVYSTPLPLDLVLFSGKYKSNSIIVSWIVAEKDISYYTVEKLSTSNIDFYSIDTVNSMGNGSHNKYSYIDYKIEKTNYYRLKMHHNDGSFTFSNTIIVDRSDNDILVTGVFPIPVAEQMNIGIYSPFNGDIEMEVYDLTGRIVKKENALVIKGDNNIDVDFSNLFQGVYFVHLYHEKKCFSVFRVVKI
jgi:Secretion system C-terminal sorting domain